MATQGFHCFSSGNVPHANRVILAATDKQLARRRERDRAHWAIVSGKPQIVDLRLFLTFDPAVDVDLRELVRVPDHDQLVVTTGGYGFAIGCEACCVDGSVVSQERIALLEDLTLTIFGKTFVPDDCLSVL